MFPFFFPSFSRSSITICHHRRHFNKQNVFSSSHTTVNADAAVVVVRKCRKIMKPFTQLSEKTTKSSCLMLSTTKSLLMMSHYPFLSLSLSVSSRSAATNIGIAVFNKALNEIRRGKVFFSLFCKTLPSYHH